MASKNMPKLKRQPAGKTKVKAVAKANPTTPAQRQYKWGKQSGGSKSGY
jgi:hypothetical protein